MLSREAENTNLIVNADLTGNQAQ